MGKQIGGLQSGRCISEQRPTMARALNAHQSHHQCPDQTKAKLVRQSSDEVQLHQQAPWSWTRTCQRARRGREVGGWVEVVISYSTDGFGIGAARCSGSLFLRLGDISTTVRTGAKLSSLFSLTLWLP